MKTHVLLLSKKFLKGHRREGELTEFRKHFLNGTKIHTVRENYEYWAPRIQEVMDGVAILSIRQWIDEPYKKPGQIEIGQLTNTSGIGYQRCMVDELNVCVHKINTLYSGIHRVTFAHNDGLSIKNFQSWFSGKKPNKQNPQILIHFTDFRY